MKKRTVALIILLAGAALVGIILVQVYWMRNAITLQEELFDNKVNVTLRSVVNAMFADRQHAEGEPFVCSPGCDLRTHEVLSAINPVKLDSLLHLEFNEMDITKEHIWGVYDPSSGNFFAGENTEQKDKLISAGHRIPLSCLYRQEQLMLAVYFPNENQAMLATILPWMIVSVIFIIVVVFAFSYMIFSFMKQKKLSEIKADFVNNMTHELKTPISTISLASEMLLNPKNLSSEDKTRKYAKMIFDENQRMQQQVDHVLQMAVLENEAFKLDLVPVDAHVLIRQCISRFDLVIRNVNGNIKFYPEADEAVVVADYVHLQNVICNLLDNAVKYSHNKVDITVRTYNQNGMFMMSFVDKGIGINSENQKLIFEKMYRVPTGNRHDVKGFGIGLYYVKKVTDALNGRIKVTSEPDKGSVFEISLPVNVSVETHEA